MTAADEYGHLLTVRLIESPTVDDKYEIRSARYLDAEESAAASMLLTPQQGEALTDDIRRFDPSIGDVIERPHSTAKAPLSARVSIEVSDWLYRESVTRKISPSQLVDELLREAMRARTDPADKVVVNLADLHRAIDAVAREQAA